MNPFSHLKLDSTTIYQHQSLTPLHDIIKVYRSSGVVRYEKRTKSGGRTMVELKSDKVVLFEPSTIVTFDRMTGENTFNRFSPDSMDINYG